jgi:hypothetical protein
LGRAQRLKGGASHTLPEPWTFDSGLDFIEVRSVFSKDAFDSTQCVLRGLAKRFKVLVDLSGAKFAKPVDDSKSGDHASRNS